MPGVRCVLTAADVPGVNDAGVKHDEPLFPDEVRFHGHAVCWVLGETLEAARLGAAAVVLDLEPLPALVNVKEAIEATVADLQAKGAEFRGAIEQREYGRVVMMAVPGADDIQLYEPSHKLAYTPP